MSFPPIALRSLQQWLCASSAFTRTWLCSPRTVGMVCPSGTALAECMAAGIPDTDGIVVELGAGTGTVTRQILLSGVSPERLLVLERAPAMAKLLRTRFADLDIVQGDAERLPSFLPQGRKAACIVSSLPLLSLGEDVRRRIVCSMRDALEPGGVLIQYTYSWRKANAFLNKGFRCIESRQVWSNVPPARVFRFERE